MAHYCGTTEAGAEVFAEPAYLDRHDGPAAIRHATSATGRIAPDFGPVMAVLLESYGPRDFGPNGRYWTDRGFVGWFTYPGGMQHGNLYNIRPGIGPEPATHLYPQPTHDERSNTR